MRVSLDMDDFYFAKKKNLSFLNDHFFAITEPARHSSKERYKVISHFKQFFLKSFLSRFVLPLSKCKNLVSMFFFKKKKRSRNFQN